MAVVSKGFHQICKIHGPVGVPPDQNHGTFHNRYGGGAFFYICLPSIPTQNSSKEKLNKF